MTMQVYRFSVEVKGVKAISRVIDISADSTVADLAYVILSTFETLAYHLRNICFQENNYDCMVDVEDYFGDEELIDATKTVLSNIGLEE
jgi:hypothetical protein